MATREADTKGGSLESGCTKKEPFHSTSPDSLGMGTRSKGYDGAQMPSGNPTQSAPNGHKIK